MWFFYALLSALNSSLVAIFAKIGLKSIQPVKGIALGSIILGIFGLIIGFIYDGLALFQMPSWSIKDWSFFGLSIIAGALSWLFYFLALKTGSPSDTIAVTTLSIVFIIFLSAIFLKEIITAKMLAGAFMMVAGASLIIIK